MAMKDYENVDQYIVDQSDEMVRERLEKIRMVIRQTVPEAEETISYKMPSYKLNGILVYFAAFKHHIGFFPTPNGVDHFKEKLSIYKTSKGTIQFLHKQVVPYDLIKEIVLYRVKENSEKASAKNTKEYITKR